MPRVKLLKKPDVYLPPDQCEKVKLGVSRCWEFRELNFIYSGSRNCLCDLCLSVSSPTFILAFSSRPVAQGNTPRHICISSLALSLFCMKCGLLLHLCKFIKARCWFQYVALIRHSVALERAHLGVV